MGQPLSLSGGEDRNVNRHDIPASPAEAVRAQEAGGVGDVS